MDINNLNKYVDEYYVDLLNLVKLRTTIEFTDNRSSFIECGLEYRILLCPQHEVFTWVHEAAHYLYTLLSFEQVTNLQTSVEVLCCYYTPNYIGELLSQCTSSEDAYRYSALTDAYTIYRGADLADVLENTSYAYKHQPGYGLNRELVYATKEAWAAACELIMYDIKPPRELKDFYEAVAIMLEELMIELF